MAHKLVIIGNGMVTGRFLDELLAYNADAFEITVISAEAFGSYNRIMLSSVLSGEATIPSIVQKTPQWYHENDITLHQNESVSHIDKAHLYVVTDKGRKVAYDHLVIATGSRSSKIPAKNLTLNNIFPFRSINDTQRMLERAKTAKTAIVVGGGFLGLEAAWGLAESGVHVTLVHRSAWLLNRQLDQTAAEMLRKSLVARGLHFTLSNEVECFLGEQDVSGARLKNGEHLGCDMAVIATGITPNAEIAWDAGLDGERAIHVDELMQTSDQHISAIGECVEFEGKTFGLVDPLWRHAKVLASRLCGAFEQQKAAEEQSGSMEQSGQKPLVFRDAPIATKLKISGINLYSAGFISAPEDATTVVVQDAKANIYRKLIMHNNRIVGIVLYGDVRSGAWFFELMQNQEDVSSMLPNLLFGEAYVAA